MINDELTTLVSNFHITEKILEEINELLEIVFNDFEKNILSNDKKLIDTTFTKYLSYYIVFKKFKKISELYFSFYKENNLEEKEKIKEFFSELTRNFEIKYFFYKNLHKDFLYNEYNYFLEEEHITIFEEYLKKFHNDSIKNFIKSIDIEE